jgi:hypothetical protein
MGMEVAVQKM